MGDGTAVELARFGWHPDPAIDFCIEVDVITGEYQDILAGYKTPTRQELEGRVSEAMQFRVGGVPSCVSAKNNLREIERRLALKGKAR